MKHHVHAVQYTSMNESHQGTISWWVVQGWTAALAQRLFSMSDAAHPQNTVATFYPVNTWKKKIRLKVKIPSYSFNKSLKIGVTWFFDVVIFLLELLHLRWQCFLAVSLLLFWTVSDCLRLYVSYVTLWLLQSHKGTSDKTAEEASLGSDPHSLETVVYMKWFSECLHLVGFWHCMPPMH